MKIKLGQREDKRGGEVGCNIIKEGKQVQMRRKKKWERSVKMVQKMRNGKERAKEVSNGGNIKGKS